MQYDERNIQSLSKISFLAPKISPVLARYAQTEGAQIDLSDSVLQTCSTPSGMPSHGR